jgi:hypothetical protein
MLVASKKISTTKLYDVNRRHFDAHSNLSALPHTSQDGTGRKELDLEEIGL